MKQLVLQKRYQIYAMIQANFSKKHIAKIL